ncbi:unnamed protein product [Orchesella dallaii]|uniref:Tudor domain-containing protein n=1 Tax=Orchesella dallaii TaxID=48710 RepID=A0ABP1PT28_9HEXA
MDNITFRARSGMGSISSGGGEMKGIPCKNVRCDQEMFCVNNADLYCSRECYSVKSEQEQFDVDTSDVKFKRRSIIGRGGTGLISDLSALDRLIIHVDKQYGRIVTLHKGMMVGREMKTKKKGQLLDPEEILRKQKKKEDKRKLRELLNNLDEEDSSDDTSCSSEDDLDDAQSSPVNPLICPPHPPLVAEEGKLLKCYVINSVSPWEIHVQTGKMIRKAEEIDAICNKTEGIDPRLVDEHWTPQVGGVCCAKYDDRMYRAKILEKNGKNYQVLYIDYGNKALVPANDVQQLSPEITLIPAQSVFFKLSNAKPKKHRNPSGYPDWNRDVNQFTMKHLEGAAVGLKIEAVENREIHVGKLSVISSLSGLVCGDFGEGLVAGGMADPDSYYLDQLKNL